MEDAHKYAIINPEISHVDAITASTSSAGTAMVVTAKVKKNLLSTCFLGNSKEKFSVRAA